MDINWLIIVGTGGVLGLQSVRQKEWKRVAGFVAITATIVAVTGLPRWYTPDLTMTSVDLVSKTYPPTMTLPHMGYPGLRRLACQVSGMHSINTAPAIPDDLNSETATTTAISTVPLAGWMPQAASSTVGMYTWEDWVCHSMLILGRQHCTPDPFAHKVIFSHKTMKWPFYFHPSYDALRCGLGPGANIWTAFPDGGTYCRSSETFYVKPTTKKACLGDFIASLVCQPGRGYCHLPSKCIKQNPKAWHMLTQTPTGSATVTINGVESSSSGTSFALSPFDSDIRSGTATPACTALFNNYYLGISSISISFTTSGRTLTRKEESLVPETIQGSRHLDNVIKCNLSSADVPNSTLVVGLLPTGISFVYNANNHTVDLYTSHKVTLSNDWRSVLIMNLCLVCLAHWLADVGKSANTKWTVVPEIVGLFAAASGVYLQRISNSVYHRCADIPNGPLAAELVTWIVLLEIAADVACLVLLRATKDEDENGINKNVKGKINNIRRLSYECALLGSVFLQVVSSSDSMFDSYMSFFVGAALLYSATYRCLQTFVEDANRNVYKNHIVVRLLATCIFCVSFFAFYTLAAMPSVDPVAGLSHHIVEAGTLCTAAIVVFGVVGLAERI